MGPVTQLEILGPIHKKFAVGALVASPGWQSRLSQILLPQLALNSWSIWIMVIVPNTAKPSVIHILFPVLIITTQTTGDYAWPFQDIQ